MNKSKDKYGSTNGSRLNIQLELVLLFYLQLYSINLAGPKNSNWIFKRLTLVDPYLSLLLFIIYSNRSNTHNVNKKLTLPRLFEQTQCVSDKE